MSRVLVTGGAGFIGSNFVRHLFEAEPETEIVVLDLLTYAGSLENLSDEILASPRFQFWHGDIRSADLVLRLVGEVDAVVHFAAETHVARSIYENRVFYETDVLGTQSVANAVLTHADRIERFVHISSSEVYGTAADPSAPMDEAHPLNPLSPYASAKAGADRLVYSYHATYGIPATILRPFNNYGPRQHLEKVIPRFVTSALLGEPMTIHGNGGAARDWLFVEDCCAGIRAALRAPRAKVVGEALNLGTGLAVSVRGIAERIARILGVPLRAERIEDRPGQVDRHIAEIGKARALLGWSPRVDLDAGLSRTIDWYRANEPWWRPQIGMRKIQVRLRDGRRILH